MAATKGGSTPLPEEATGGSALLLRRRGWVKWVAATAVGAMVLTTIASPAAVAQTPPPDFAQPKVAGQSAQMNFVDPSRQGPSGYPTPLDFASEAADPVLESMRARGKAVPRIPIGKIGGALGTAYTAYELGVFDSPRKMGLYDAPKPGTPLLSCEGHPKPDASNCRQVGTVR